MIIIILIGRRLRCATPCYACRYVCLCVYRDVHIRACIHIHVSLSLSLSVYIYIYTHLYIYIYIHASLCYAMIPVSVKQTLILLAVNVGLTPSPLTSMSTDRHSQGECNRSVK